MSLRLGLSTLKESLPIKLSEIPDGTFQDLSLSWTTPSDLPAGYFRIEFDSVDRFGRKPYDIDNVRLFLDSPTISVIDGSDAIWLSGRTDLLPPPPLPDLWP